MVAWLRGVHWTWLAGGAVALMVWCAALDGDGARLVRWWRSRGRS